MINNKGFSLITVIVLSFVIFLIGGTGLYIASTSFRATRADTNLNLAEKASNSGLLKAVDQINMAGALTGDLNFSGLMGSSPYETDVMFGGRNVWFINSVGHESSAKISKVVKSSMFQGYYGVGLYTVRGNVNATIGGTRFSGCDTFTTTDTATGVTTTNTCFVPAFIAAGTINVNTTPQSCSAAGATNQSTVGLFGEPATLNINQGDLSRIFFRVRCFNRFFNGAATGCTRSLLDFFDFDYGRNPSNTSVYDFSFQQNDANTNSWGIPVVTLPAIPVGACVNAQANVNLAGLGCNAIVINTNNVAITGNGNIGGQPVEIYAYNVANMSLNNATNFILYTNSPVSLNNTIGTADAGLNPLNNSFRIISTNEIVAGANASLLNGTIVSGPTNVAATDVNTAPHNLTANGSITINDVNLFVRSLQLANNSTVRILNSLVYVYAFACPTCSRANSNTGSTASSFGACISSSSLWCGLFGQSGINLNIGRDAAGAAQPTLFISNNSTLAAGTTAAYIWGVWYGEDVTYLSTSSVDLRGFLIRNFPSNLTLTINIGGSFTMNFSKDDIDLISGRYRFFRQVDCVRNPVTPSVEMIQTRMTNY